MSVSNFIPPHSPDMYPIKHLLDELKCRVRKHQVISNEHLKKSNKRRVGEYSARACINLSKKGLVLLLEHGNCTKP